MEIITCDSYFPSKSDDQVKDCKKVELPKISEESSNKVSTPPREAAKDNEPQREKQQPVRISTSQTEEQPAGEGTSSSEDTDTDREVTQVVTALGHAFTKLVDIMLSVEIKVRGADVS